MSLELKSGDVHGQNLKTRRKNTTKACDECRRRRAKCDGKQPTCTRCNDRGLICHFSAHEDGRRPAPKSYVDMLRKRISVLEKVLEAHSIDVESSVARILAQERAKSGTGDPSSSAAVEESLSAFDGVLSLDDNAASLERDDTSYFGAANGHLESHILTPDGEPDDPFNNSVPSPTKPGFSQFRLRVDQLLIQDVAYSCEVSKELENHLIDLYFLWEQPWCQVVNEQLFRQSLGNKGRYASPLLLSCVLASGSRFTDRVEVRSDPDDPNSAGQMFIEKAEKLLYYELKWPSMTTIQSASIMGTLYLSIGADAAGWLHHGIASRLAVDMGLNMDATCLVGNNLMSQEEVELRNQIYWSLYCVDKMLASYIGRVCTMLDSQGQVPMPKRPDSRAALKREARLSQGPGIEREHMRTSLHIAMMALCCILEKILVALYAPSHATRQVQRGSFVHSCLLELKGWFYDLPQELKLDRKGNTNRLPQAYILHMSYHTQHILIMKPFLVKPVTIRAEPHAQPGQNPEIVTQQALSVCYKAATSILDIIKKYQQAFGSFRNAPLSAAHCTLSAALIFIQTRPLGLDGRGGSTDCNNIELCLKVLDELSVAWSPARSMHKNLSKLYAQEFTFAPARPMDAVFNPSVHHPPMVAPLPQPAKGPHFRGMQSLPGNPLQSNQMRMMTDDDIWNAEWPDTIMETPLFPDVGLDFVSQSLPGDYTNFENLGRTFHS